MQLFPLSSRSSSVPDSSPSGPKDEEHGHGYVALLYLNVYDLPPLNNYLYWIWLGTVHSGIEGDSIRFFGLKDEVFEVERRSCPGFIFKRSMLIGSLDMSRSEFQSFLEQFSGKYHGDSYHLIAKNSNHFTDEVCSQLTGKSIPRWVNRLARIADMSDSEGSFRSGEYEEDKLDQHLLAMPHDDLALSDDKPVRLPKELL